MLFTMVESDHRNTTTSHPDPARVRRHATAGSEALKTTTPTFVRQPINCHGAGRLGHLASVVQPFQISRTPNLLSVSNVVSSTPRAPSSIEKCRVDSLPTGPRMTWVGSVQDVQHSSSRIERDLSQCFVS